MNNNREGKQQQSDEEKNLIINDKINDLAELIKYACRESPRYDFEKYKNNIDVGNKKGAIDMFIAWAILFMKELKEKGNLPDYNKMLEEQKKLYTIYNEDIEKNAKFYQQLLAIFNDKNEYEIFYNNLRGFSSNAVELYVKDNITKRRTIIENNEKIELARNQALKENEEIKLARKQNKTISEEDEKREKYNERQLKDVLIINEIPKEVTFKTIDPSKAPHATKLKPLIKPAEIFKKEANASASSKPPIGELEFEDLFNYESSGDISKPTVTQPPQEVGAGAGAGGAEAGAEAGPITTNLTQSHEALNAIRLEEENKYNEDQAKLTAAIAKCMDSLDKYSKSGGRLLWFFRAPNAKFAISLKERIAIINGSTNENRINEVIVLLEKSIKPLKERNSVRLLDTVNLEIAALKKLPKPIKKSENLDKTEDVDISRKNPKWGKSR